MTNCKIPEMVFTLTYTHKHGSDVGVYKTREGADAAAYGLACERVEEWDEEGACRLHFESLEDRDEQMDYFHEIEGEMSCGELLEINETELQS